MLGVPGLIHAYKTGAAEVLEKSGKEEKRIKEIYNISVPYESFGMALNLIKESKGKIIRKNVENISSIEFEIEKNNADPLINKLKSVKDISIKFLFLE